MRHSQLYLHLYMSLLLMTGVLGRVIYEPSSGLLFNDPDEVEEEVEPVLEDDTSDDDGDDRDIVDDNDDEDAGRDEDDIQQLITLSSALADDEPQQRRPDDEDDDEEIPQVGKRSSPLVEGFLVTPVDASPGEPPLESVVDELRKENAILRSEVLTLMEALSNSAKVIEAQENEEDKKRFTEDVIRGLINAEKMEEKLEENEDESSEPVTEQDIEENEEPIVNNKRTEEVFSELGQPLVNLDQDQGKGQCAAVERLTDGCRSLADRYHLTMDEEARSVCSAHQLCYSCAYPDREAMGGCDVIYRKQTNQMCNAEDTEDPNKCKQEADQLLSLMQLEHTQSSQQHHSNMEEGELRGMCEMPCSLTAMLVK